jgi:gluconolactonase
MTTPPTPCRGTRRRQLLCAALIAPFLASGAVAGALAPKPAGPAAAATAGKLHLAAAEGAGALFDKDAALKVVATGFGFVEGVIWVPEGDGGHLLFSDIPANVIYRAEPDGTVSLHLEKSGYQKPDLWRTGMRFNNGKDPSDPGYEEFNLSGSNGLALDREGRLVIATWGGRTVDRIEADGSRTVLAERYDGKRFGGTNDVIVASDGRIYFADGFGGMPKYADDPSNEMKMAGIYMIRDGVVSRVAGDLPDANGLALSPDEKTLYANASAANYILRYDVNADGSLSAGQPFADLGKTPGKGITDGMKVDVEGNLWASGPGGIHIFSPAGEALGFIPTPEAVGNLAFGGADRKTLYVAAATSIYAMPVNVAGLP